MDDNNDNISVRDELSMGSSNRLTNSWVHSDKPRQMPTKV